MAIWKVASKATVKNDAYTRPVTQSDSKKNMQERKQGFVLTKKCQEQLMGSPKSEVVIRENLLFNNSTLASDLSEKESHLEKI